MSMRINTSVIGSLNNFVKHNIPAMEANCKNWETVKSTEANHSNSNDPKV